MKLLYINIFDQERGLIIILKPNQYVETKWNNFTKKYYQSLGYEYTQTGDSFKVKVEDLPKKSRIKVKVVCDFCGKEFDMFMYAYTYSTENREKVACTKCKHIKTQETMMETYGVTSSLKIESVREKAKQTLIKNYGVEHPLLSKQILQKSRESTFEHYGVYNSMQSKEVQNSVKATMRERYGVDNAGKCIPMVEKAKQTCTEKYGGESSQSSAEIRQKSMKTLIKNSTIPTSKPEKEMVKLLKEIYGKKNCHPQYPLGRISFDCLLVVDGVKIDVEYDGIFWHDKKKEYDKRRDFYCMRNGYKVLRFRGESTPPTKEQIIEGVNCLVNSSHKHYKIDI